MKLTSRLNETKSAKRPARIFSYKNMLMFRYHNRLRSLYKITRLKLYLSFTYQFAPATYTGCRIRGSAFVINRLQNKVGLPQKVVSNIKHEISLKIASTRLRADHATATK